MTAAWLRLYDDSWGVKLDHSCAKPGDIVTVLNRQGGQSDETLKKCLSEGARWSIWRVLAPGESLTPAQPLRLVQARRPLLRREGRWQRLPVVQPDPPAHTDADAPPPEDDSEVA